MIRALTNSILFTGTEKITGKSILIENDRIVGIRDSKDIPPDAVVIDCEGHIIAPGLIDLQIYGGGGYLFSNKPSVEALHSITDAILRSGTTAFMLTLATNSMDIFREAIQIVKQYPHPALLGLHLEGPYINPIKRGAHIEKYIRLPELDEVRSLLEEAEGVIKMITLAPERTDPAIIRLLLDHGVLISAGHSNATYKEAVSGFKNGIQTTTHLFNAMSPFHHRDTGLPGAAFQTEGVYASIIADGIHVDYQALSVSKKLMGERLFLITDAVEENREGAYVHVKGKDRFTLPDGTLSGSNLSLIQAVSNCVHHAGIPMDEALRMATLYPARLLNAGATGMLEAGAKANIIVFDKDFKIRQVYLEGEAV